MKEAKTTLGSASVYWFRKSMRQKTRAEQAATVRLPTNRYRRSPPHISHSCERCPLQDALVAAGLSSDPIGYVDGPNMYSNCFLLRDVDPSRETITVDPAWSDNKDTCLQGGTRRFYVVVEDVPCDGYIVAFVKATCRNKSCPDCDTDIQNEKISGFQVVAEVTKTKPGEGIRKVASPQQGVVGDQEGTCGSYELAMEFRLFCKANAPDFKKWNDMVKGACYEPTGSLWLKASAANNGFWAKDYEKKFGAASLSVNATWKCCLCAQQSFVVSSKPSYSK